MRLFCFLLIALSFSLAENIQAQEQVYDSVSTQPGYQYDVWYSLEKGEVKRKEVTEWDLAFQIEPREAGVRINSIKGVKLWLLSTDKDDWENPDTTGKLVTENQLYNSDTSWNYGAFNMPRNWRDPFDYGWGQYNQVRQVVVGRNVYAIKLADNQLFKIMIDSIDTNASRFKVMFAGLDNSNLTTFYVDRTQFPNRNFAYYNFGTNLVTDLEPDNRTWDLLFCQYYTTIQGEKYPVAGVLHNHIRTFFTSVGTQSAKVFPVAPNILTDSGANYRTEINTIGSDWKTFDQQTLKYNIQDSLVYFVKSNDRVDKNTYKLVFTGFGGRSNGTFNFYKQLIGGVNRFDLVETTLKIYPSPSNNFIFIDKKDTHVLFDYEIFDMTGKIILTGRTLNQIDVKSLPKGIYGLTLENNATREVVRFIKE